MMIRELAVREKVAITDIKQLLRRAFPGVDVDSPDRTLTSEQIQRVQALLPAHNEARRHGTVDLTAEQIVLRLPPATTEAPFAAVSVRPGSPRSGRGFRLVVHQDVLDFLLGGPGERRPLQAAVLRLMREMLVHGRAQRSVKGTRGVNSGWLRAPIGDNGGSHYYLWHALAGTRRVDELGLERGDVVLRAVLHHDATKTPLSLGNRGDYLDLDAKGYVEEVEGAHGAADALSLPQRQACDHGASISITKGHPGAGKTSLHLERTRRHRGRLLFVTFGAAQRAQAERWLATYAHDGQVYLAWTHQDFFERLDPSWRPPPPQAHASDVLRKALAAEARSLGPWRGHEAALYAELRGHYWGRALPFDFRDVAGASTDEELARSYRERRSKMLEAAAVEGALHVARTLSSEVRAQLFGDLDRARAIATRLGTPEPELPAELTGLDAILIDEVQDLTLVELLVCTLVAQRSGREAGWRTALHVAGDEGQTVRATDFEWGELKNLVNDTLGRPDEFDLPGNVRSPRTITRVINNSWNLYKAMAKKQRPRGYAEALVEETALGTVLWVDLQPGDLDAFCKVVADTPGAALIYPGTEVPAEVLEAAERARVVHTVAAPEAKGLDFRVAFVLDVGRRADELYQSMPKSGDAQIVELENRAAVDAIRVAISRATEVLVFAERPLDREARARLHALCSDGELFDGVVTDVKLAELADRLDVDTDDRVELVTAALADFDRTFEDDPETGLRIAEKARGWLGDSNRAGAVQGDLRKQVHHALGRALLRTALAHESDLSSRLTRANAEFNLAKAPELARLALDARDALSDDDTPRRAVTNIVAQATNPDSAGRRDALAVIARLLSRAKDRCSRYQAKDWERLVTVLESLVEVATASSGVNTARSELAWMAADWALSERSSKSTTTLAERAIGMIADPPLALRARLAERLERWDEAIELYRATGDYAEALRVSRERGDDVSRSLELARAGELPGAATLERLECLCRDLDVLSVGQLTDRERALVLDLVKQKLPARKR